MGTASSVNSVSRAESSITGDIADDEVNVAGNRTRRSINRSSRQRSSNLSSNTNQKSTSVQGAQPTIHSQQQDESLHTAQLTGTSQYLRESHNTTLGERAESTKVSTNVHASTVGRGSVGGSPLRSSNTNVSQNTTAHATPLSLKHIQLIQEAFKFLSTELGVYFEIEQILSTARVLYTEPATVVIVAKSEPTGVYVVAEGTYSQVIPDSIMTESHITNSSHCTRMGELTSGEMFGELSTLMSIPNIMTIKCEESGTLIQVPFDSVVTNISGKVLSAKARSWCVKRALVHTFGLFDNKTLVLLTILSAIKSTKQFSDWRYESLEYMSRLCQLTLFESNENLFRVGDPSTNLFVVIRGRARVSNKSNQRFEDISVTCTNNSLCIGDQDFFLKQPRKQTAISLSPLLVVPLTREIILATIDEFVDQKTKLQELMRGYYLK